MACRYHDLHRVPWMLSALAGVCVLDFAGIWRLYQGQMLLWTDLLIRGASRSVVSGGRQMEGYCVRCWNTYLGCKGPVNHTELECLFNDLQLFWVIAGSWESVAGEERE